MASIPTQEDVLAATRKGQEAMMAAVKTWLETVRTATPRLPSKLPQVGLPFADRLPTPQDAVANAYHLAEQLLASQRRFAEELVKATAPLRPGYRESSPEVPSPSAWQDAVTDSEPKPPAVIAAPKAAENIAPKAAPSTGPKAAESTAPKAAPSTAPKAAESTAPKAAPSTAPKAARERRAEGRSERRPEGCAGSGGGEEHAGPDGLTDHGAEADHRWIRERDGHERSEEHDGESCECGAEERGDHDPGAEGHRQELTHRPGCPSTRRRPRPAGSTSKPARASRWPTSRASRTAGRWTGPRPPWRTARPGS